MHDKIEEISFKMISKSLKLSERKKVFNVPKKYKLSGFEILQAKVEVTLVTTMTKVGKVFMSFLLV